jgi:hypothetical protein
MSAPSSSINTQYLWSSCGLLFNPPWKKAFLLVVAYADIYCSEERGTFASFTGKRGTDMNVRATSPGTCLLSAEPRSEHASTWYRLASGRVLLQRRSSEPTSTVQVRPRFVFKIYTQMGRNADSPDVLVSRTGK